MTISIQVPEDVVARLRAGWGDLPLRALEALAVDAYRDELLTSAEVGQLLGHTSRWETEAFLHARRAYLSYDVADAGDDRERLRDPQRP